MGSVLPILMLFASCIGYVHVYGVFIEQLIRRKYKPTMCVCVFVVWCSTQSAHNVRQNRFLEIYSIEIVMDMRFYSVFLSCHSDVRLQREQPSFKLSAALKTSHICHKFNKIGSTETDLIFICGRNMHIRKRKKLQPHRIASCHIPSTICGERCSRTIIQICKWVCFDASPAIDFFQESCVRSQLLGAAKIPSHKSYPNE